MRAGLWAGKSQSLGFAVGSCRGPILVTDLGDHQAIAVGVGEPHLLARAGGSVLDLADLDSTGDEVLAEGAARSLA
jgi:hypothetical protein